ncbi:MAG: hypothetical protein HUU30_18555 [Burkholderiaceae bacterium]|nr:hypothetical protein [Aquabacterium sp.]NUP87735.1 hypothetical protein [Burkholderiaceae bacterium]
MSRRRRHRLSQHLVALSIATALCVPPAWARDNQAGMPEPTPAEKAMQQDLDRANKTVLGGVVVGAAVGAVAGAFLAKLAGGNAKDTRNAALAGAVAGGALGGLDGYRTAKLEKAGNDQVRALQLQTADVDTETLRLRQAVASTERALAEREVALTALRDDVASGRVTADQAREQVKRDEQNLAKLNKTLETQKKTYDDHVKVANSFKVDDGAKRDSEAKLAQYRAEIDNLNRAISSYSGAVLAVSRV